MVAAKKSKQSRSKKSRHTADCTFSKAAGICRFKTGRLQLRMANQIIRPVNVVQIPVGLLYTPTEKSAWWLAKAIWLQYGAQLQTSTLRCGSRQLTLSNAP
jgi:hypothetical protein